MLTISARTWHVAVVVPFSLLASPAAHAIVNIEDMHGDAVPEGFSGKIALDAGGERGNSDRSSLGTGARTQWKYGRTLDFIVFNYNSGQTNGQRDVNNGFVHARHIDQVTPVTAWEAFTQASQNEFQRLSYRGLIGGGGRFTLYRSVDRQSEFLVGTGAFYEREKLDDEAGTTDAGIETTTRANLYIVFNYRLNDHVRLQSTTYYQPSFSNIDDFRGLEQATLLVKLADRLDLKLQVDAAYDSRPPQLVERGDLVYRTGLEYRF